MRTCENCGMEVPDDWNYCTNCGSELMETDQRWVYRFDVGAEEER